MIKLIKESNDDYSYNLENDLYNYVGYHVSRLVRRLEKDGFHETDGCDYEDGSRDCVWTDDRTATVKVYLDDRWHVRNVVVTSISNDFDERFSCIKEELRRGRYWVTDDDYIPLPNQPEEGYTKLGAIERAQREAERVSKYSRRTDRVSVSDAAEWFHIMDSDGNIVHELDSAI